MTELATPRGWTSQVVVALAERIAGAGIGVWRPTGVYSAVETAIVVKAMPANPVRVIAITPYTVAESVHLSDKTQGFQIRCRAGTNPNDVDDLADGLRELLHGAHDFELGPARIAAMWRQSHGSMGADGSGRWQTSSNFYAQTAQPTTQTAD